MLEKARRAAELRPELFYLGVAYVALGLLVSARLVRDTGEHVRLDLWIFNAFGLGGTT